MSETRPAVVMPSSGKNGDTHDNAERGSGRTGMGAMGVSSSMGSSDGTSSIPPPPAYNTLNGRARRGRGELGDVARGNSSSNLGSSNHDRRRRPSAEPVPGDRTRSRGERNQVSGNGDLRRNFQSGGGDRGNASLYDGVGTSERSLGVSINEGTAMGDGGGVGANGDILSSSGHRPERRGSGSAAPRVVHRVGMECLSPINVSKTDGTTTSGE